MKQFTLVLVFSAAITLGWAQSSPPVAAPVTVPTNETVADAAPETNNAAAAAIELLELKINSLESRLAAKDSDEAYQLRLQRLEAETRLDRSREAEANRAALINVLFLVGALAAVSILGLVVFCFYALRRITALSVPVSEPSHTQHRPPVAMLPATQAVEGNHQSSVAIVPKAETRLLDAVDRLEKRIEDVERAAHQDNPLPAPAAPSSNGPELLALGNHGQPDRAMLFLSKGEAHANLQQLDKAIACFDEAAALAPKDATPWIKKGYALEKLGRLEQAVACYDEALQLDPGCSLAYLLKGAICNRLQKYAEAIECYDRALAAQPS